MTEQSSKLPVPYCQVILQWNGVWQKRTRATNPDEPVLWVGVSKPDFDDEYVREGDFLYIVDQ